MTWYIIFRKSKSADVTIVCGKKQCLKYGKNAPNEQYPSKDVCINRAKSLGYSYAIIDDKIVANEQAKKQKTQPARFKDNIRAGKIEIDTADGTITLKRPRPYTQPISDYKEYLKSQHWQQMRKLRMIADDNTCQMCGAKSNLQVHHITYTHIGNEKLSDLITLCEKCHKKIHNANKHSGRKGKTN